MDKILCIGQATCDITIPIDMEIKDNHKFTIHEEIIDCGGPAMTAACVCGKWGAETDLISRIGNDDTGKSIRDKLDFFSINTGKLIIKHQYTTPYSYIFVNKNNGNRTIFNNPGNNNDIVQCDVECAYKVILTDGRDLDLSLKSFETNPDAKKIIDAGTYRETTLALAKKTDYLICSKYFAEQYTNMVIDTDLHNICEVFKAVENINNAIAIITLGNRGLVFRDSDEKIKIFPAYQVKTVDTTGAGDIFHGAFAWAISKELNYFEAIKFAVITASMSTRSIGGQESIPDLRDVLQVNEQWKPETVICS
ncbi:carbohydrate kinase family protein [Amygdalobacter nucleatus]|uniref:carbohydrate kinase family protein n=1 Tax=Amygdalobacter nucleatus TaxID=3029274 RepID=UPI0027994F3C|nr:carbohydrate kinase family protein [Amygdalobacter nucleatus]WEG37130.1 carbohydrate kinase family protein [Amygdalobacter nucleatus]